jgi:hypothetical protein
MINSSNFGEHPHNAISPMRASIKAEVEDVRESVVASELIPEDSLRAGSNKEASCGKLQEDSSVESPQSESNTGTTAAEKEPCVYCGQIPCDWLTFETEICGECEQLEDEKRNNKEIRHHAYRLYTRLRHGVLRKFDRRPLLICVRGEIMDNWPDPNHSYVGFQDSLRDVSKIG